MNSTVILRLLLLCVLATPINLSAQEAPQKGSITVGINPAYFTLGGYHLNPQYHFPRKWSVGATLQGGFTLPDFARDQFFATISNDNIKVDWNYAIGAEVKYRFSDVNYDKGFFLASALGYEAWEVMSGANTSAVENWFASFGIGYNWYPTKNQRLHLGVQYNLIFLLNNTDESAVGDERYALDPVVPPGILPSVFIIGWRF